jgi:hypothetical protein
MSLNAATPNQSLYEASLIAIAMPSRFAVANSTKGLSLMVFLKDDLYPAFDFKNA